MPTDKPVGGNDAFSLFPDLMKDVFTAKAEVAQETSSQPPPPKTLQTTAPAARPSVVPPPPYPDIRWLSGGEYVGKSPASKERKALVVMKDEKGRAEVLRAFQELGYKTTLAGSEAEAIEMVNGIDFAAIAADVGFMGGPLAQSAFHSFMKGLPMERRRLVHYTFVGPEAHTLYNLEALAESVNLVINAQDVTHFDILLRKGLLEYKNLFQPYANALANRRKLTVRRPLMVSHPGKKSA